MKAVAVLVVENETRKIQRLAAPAFGNGPFPERRLLLLVVTPFIPQHGAPIAAVVVVLVVIQLVHWPRPILAEIVHGTHPHCH